MKRFDERNVALQQCLRARREIERKYPTIEALGKHIDEVERELREEEHKREEATRSRQRHAAQGNGAPRHLRTKRHARTK